jgi:SAM-dependent methyltransferase
MKISSFNPKHYWETRLSERFTLQGVGYASYSNAYNHWLYRAKIRCLNAVLQAIRWNPLMSSVLDIGCGTGYFTEFYAKLSPVSYTGVDISNTSIQKLKPRFPQYAFYRAEFGDVRLTLPKKKYNLIHCFDVIYHITDDIKFNRAIKQFDQLLCPGGWCLVTDFYGDSDQKTSDHAKQRSKASWEKALQNTSLNISRVLPLYVLLNRPMGHESVLVKKILFRLARTPWVLYLLDCILTPIIPQSASMNLIILQKRIFP